MEERFQWRPLSVIDKNVKDEFNAAYSGRLVELDRGLSSKI